MLIKQLLFILSIIIINSTVCLLFNKKFGFLIPFTFISFVLVFYVTGIIGTLTIGLYFYYLIVVLSFIYTMVKIIKTPNKFKDNIMTFGLYAFVVIYVFVVLLNYNRTFSLVDEWGHWGIMAKETFRLRRFHAFTDSLVWMHKVYPPFYQLLEAAYCLILGNFKEAYCYQILQIFSLTLLLPMLEKNMKTINKIFILILIVLLPNIICFTSDLVYPSLFYNSIYTDWPIAFYIGFIFYFIVKEKFDNKLDYVLLTILLSGLVLTKQISIVFILLFVLMLIIKMILNKINIKTSWLTIFPIILPLIFFISWQYITKLYETQSDFSFSSIDVFAIFKYLQGTLTGNPCSIFTSFIDAFVNKPVIYSPIKISYFGMLIIVSILLALISIFNNTHKKDLICSAIFCLFGGIGYAYAICLSYAFSFDPSEGLTLTMYNRYMLTYIVAIMVSLFLIYIEYVKEYKLKYLIPLLCLITLTNLDTIEYNFRLKEYNKQIKDNNFDEVVKNINQNDKVLILWQNDPEKLTYYRYKMIMQLIGKNNIYRIPCYKEDGKNICEVNKNSFKNMIADYGVLFVSDYDDSFVPLWRETTDIEIPYNNTFYKIEKNNDGSLKLIILG